MHLLDWHFSALNFQLAASWNKVDVLLFLKSITFFPNLFLYNCFYGYLCHQTCWRLLNTLCSMPQRHSYLTTSGCFVLVWELGELWRAFGSTKPAFDDLCFVTQWTQDDTQLEVDIGRWYTVVVKAWPWFSCLGSYFSEPVSVVVSISHS